MYSFLQKNKKIEECNILKNKKINLENTNDFSVTCISYSKYVISTLLTELLNKSCKIVGDNYHNYVVCYTNGVELKLDASFGDFTRSKMKLLTRYYCPNNKYDKKEFLKKLKAIDLNIGYIKVDYEDIFIKNFLEKFQNLKMDKDEILINKMHMVANLYQKYDVKKYFSDSRFCVNYLMSKFLTNIEIAKVHSLVLYVNDNFDEFLNIYSIYLTNDILYYILKRDKDIFNFYEIGQIDAKSYFKNYNKKLMK